MKRYLRIMNYELRTPEGSTKSITNCNLRLLILNSQFSILNYSLLFLAVIAITSCRSHKKTVVSTPIEETSFYTSCYPIESLFVPSCKLDVSFGNQSLSLNGSIYIRRDSVCYIRGRLMIVEAVRGAIYHDSFIVVNYLQRICYKGKNEYLQKVTGYPVTPESLLMLFTADRCEKAYRDKFSFIIATGSSNKRILMQGKDRSLLEMTLGGNNHIENIALYNSRQRQPVFSATYSDYNQRQPYVLPTGFDISAHDGEKSIHIKANFREILLNQPQEVNISVPSGYEVVILQ